MDMDIFSFELPKGKSHYLPQVERFVSNHCPNYRTTSTKDSTVFKLEFEVEGAMELFKKELSANFPFMYV